MKMPVYSAKELVQGGKSIVERYDIIKQERIEIPNEVYLNIEIAKERARELNKDVELITIQ